MYEERISFYTNSFLLFNFHVSLLPPSISVSLTYLTFSIHTHHTPPRTQLYISLCIFFLQVQIAEQIRTTKKIISKSFQSCLIIDVQTVSNRPHLLYLILWSLYLQQSHFNLITFKLFYKGEIVDYSTLRKKKGK